MSASYNRRWTSDEDATAGNLYQEGVTADDVADTINRLYRNGRSTVAVRRRMQELGFGWASGIESKADSSERRRARGHQGSRIKAEGLAVAERAQPWHPARDPKPDWLRRPRK